MSTIVNTGQADAWNGPVGQHWADHHERYDGMLASFDEALFAAARIGERDRVLDVGCGSGSTTRRAARLAARGHAVGVDISEPMLARARSVSTGIENVSYEWGDAQVHPFPAGGHDVVISRGGVMFFADHTAAFANIGRSLRPGGRLAFVCPRPAAPDGEEGRVLGLLASLLAASAPQPAASRTSAPQPPPGADLAAAMASLADPGRTRKLLEGAAFGSVGITGVDAPTCWGRDAGDAVDFYVSRGPGAEVPEETLDAMRAALRPYETERGVLLKAGVWVVTARRDG
ncbi:class I SAM-dependent methyltransferase [Streptomyces sp. NPDC086835]|uniref:class I SAM-dependent methyltransferase n=1 Tax=Streptomyces sp. NPDC086835 TaxID=3365761 RepID=UPI0037FE0B16